MGFVVYKAFSIHFYASENPSMHPVLQTTIPPTAAFLHCSATSKWVFFGTCLEYTMTHSFTFYSMHRDPQSSSHVEVVISTWFPLPNPTASTKEPTWQQSIHCNQPSTINLGLSLGQALLNTDWPSTIPNVLAEHWRKAPKGISTWVILLHNLGGVHNIINSFVPHSSNSWALRVVWSRSRTGSLWPKGISNLAPLSLSCGASARIHNQARGLSSVSAQQPNLGACQRIAQTLVLLTLL